MIVLALIIIFHIFLLSKLIFFPYPELFIYSYLTKIGLIPYKEIFDQHFPGVMFFPVNLATLGIDTVYEMRLLQFGIIAVTHILIFIVSNKLFKSKLYSLIPNLLYLLWQPFFEGYVIWIDSFIPLFLLPSFYFLVLKRTNKNLFFSGLFLGIALLFKQVVGPLLVLIFLFLLYTNQPLKKNAAFILGVLIPVLLLFLFITLNIGWNEFLYWTVTFNLTTFAQMGRKSPDIGGLVKSLPLFFLGFSSILFAYAKKNSQTLMLLFVFSLGSLVFAYARFDYFHLQPAIPFVVIGTALAFKSIKKDKLFVGIALYLLLSFSVLITFYRANISDRVLFFSEHEARLSNAVLTYANPKDSVFAFGTTPHIYYLTETHPPGNVFVFQFPWFMVEAEEEILQGIIVDPPGVVLRDKNASVQGMNLVDFMPNINGHIEKYYSTIDMVDGTEIMVRN